MKLYEQSTFIGMITYNWINPFIEYCQGNELTLECLGRIPEENSSKTQGSMLTKSWEKYKNSNKYRLLRSIFDTYKYEIFLMVVCSWGYAVLETYNIFILKEIMDYIDGENDDTNKALMFVFILALFEVTAKAIHKFLDVVQFKIYYKIGVAIQKMNYSKIFRISSATNKNYKKGDLNNLMNGY